MKSPAKQIIALARLLRAAGLPISSDRIAMALAGAQLLGFTQRQEFKDGLQACLTVQHSDIPSFLLAFDLVFAQEIQQTFEEVSPPDVDSNHVGVSARPERSEPSASLEQSQPEQIEGTGGLSALEVLAHTDFAQMSAQEFEATKRAILAWHFRRPQLTSRRWQLSSQRGAPSRLSLRAMLRSQSLLGGGWEARFERRRMRPSRLVCLVDVSASMRRYSEIFLHLVSVLLKYERDFKGALEVFAFGTRLQRVTDQLQVHYRGTALHELEAKLNDARRGTRIAASLHEFNRKWAAQIQSSKATVLLLSDGLDHDDDGKLSLETELLRSRSHRLIWLNPLLRFPGFEVKARGIKAMRGHVDEFLPVHNVASVRELMSSLTLPLHLR